MSRKRQLMEYDFWQEDSWSKFFVDHMHGSLNFLNRSLQFFQASIEFDHGQSFGLSQYRTHNVSFHGKVDHHKDERHVSKSETRQRRWNTPCCRHPNPFVQIPEDMNAHPDIADRN